MYHFYCTTCITFARHWIYSKRGCLGFWMVLCRTNGLPEKQTKTSPPHKFQVPLMAWRLSGAVRIGMDGLYPTFTPYMIIMFTATWKKTTSSQIYFIPFQMRFLTKTPKSPCFCWGICFLHHFHLWSLTSRSSPISATRGLWSHVSWRRHRHESNDPEWSDCSGQRFLEKPRAPVRVEIWYIFPWLTWKKCRSWK